MLFSRVFIITVIYRILLEQFIIIVCSVLDHVMWVPCHHRRAHPWVADGGDSLHIWWIYWISSRRQLTRDGPPAWRLGMSLTTPHHKENSLLPNATQGLKLWHILWNDISKGKLTWDLAHGMSSGSAQGPGEGSSEHGNEPSDSIKCWEILE